MLICNCQKKKKEVALWNPYDKPATLGCHSEHIFQQGYEFLPPLPTSFCSFQNEIPPSIPAPKSNQKEGERRRRRNTRIIVKKLFLAPFSSSFYAYNFARNTEKDSLIPHRRLRQSFEVRQGAQQVHLQQIHMAEPMQAAQPSWHWPVLWITITII